ncbi:MAG: putative glycoside hydrolase [Bryobacteraceae bacterium]
MRSRKRYGVVSVLVLGVAALLWQQRYRLAHKPPQPAGRRLSPAPKRAAGPAPSEPQRLANPPAIVKGVYFTSWSAGLSRRIDYLVDLRRKTGLNTVVIDIKDYSGRLAYRVAVPEATRYGAVRMTVRDIDALIARLHREGIYAIARFTVFQDPVLAAARPHLAVHRRATSGLWLDRKGLAWIDPASREAWDYNLAIAADAASHGFDELNFDYVRFPSDGDLADMDFPSWDGRTPKHVAIREFFGRLRRKLAGVRISADLFGLATMSQDELEVGQLIEDSYDGFDYVCPMVYPSHFAPKFLGFDNPAEHFYEVVNRSMRQAAARLKPTSKAKLRPWLQDFSLGARYDAAMVQAQVRAVRDALGERYAGYLLWSSSNLYTREALQ